MFEKTGRVLLCGEKSCLQGITQLVRMVVGCSVTVTLAPIGARRQCERLVGNQIIHRIVL